MLILGVRAYGEIQQETITADVLGGSSGDLIGDILYIATSHITENMMTVDTIGVQVLGLSR